MPKKDYELNLEVVREKLEAVCRKVWDEDRVSAVALQAVSDEVLAGFRRAEEIISSLRQDLQTQESLIKREREMMTASVEERLDTAKVRTATVEEQLREAKAKIESLLQDLETKEEEHALFQEKYLRLEAKKDSERAAHMEKFIEEEDTKEQERETFWKQRHQALENDFKKREGEFEKKQHDIMEEMQRSTEETKKLLLQKETELMDTQKQLQAECQRCETALQGQEREYARKHAELEKLKQNLRAEIAELTQQHTKSSMEKK